ncbi:hypothetical protein TRFO_34808 [Tritrichomonas foetus]|uniref:Uncharacterized protein n=1 Tax=Tritrichomonas foetus TaxID=1144522 RepID=A0A1J4JI95_9EUKA|nr:hypothetical protein TRFO_34808 [Tritrichomonas foetus]|eukprot:OHS98858.1 hypothetical protein TRFO_34808 [Tritrichomonas foetus]
MSEEELVRIQNLKEKDAEDAANALLDQQLYDAHHDLKLLKDTREKLQAKFEELKIKMNETEEENDRLSEAFKEPPMNDDPRGSFFDQLRNLEAIQEQYKGQIQGLKAVNYSLTSEINKTANQIRLISANVSDLSEQSATVEADRQHRNGDLIQARNRLTELDEYLEQVTRECIDIKETIKRKASELKSVSVESVSTLVAQKQILDTELKAKKEKLTQLKNNERDYTMKSSADSKIRQKNQENKLSANVWMSQRLSLVSKVKRAKDELELLNSRQRGVTKSNSRVENIKGVQKWNDDDAKYAIACEIAELQKEPPKFLGNVLNTELTFKKEMEAALADIERTNAQISEFKQTTMELMHEQELTASKAEKLFLLKKELAELRSKI